jgi:antitoxin HicB
MTYLCKLEADQKAGGYTASFPDVPGAFTEGENVDEALFNAWEALNGVLASMVSRGERLPEARTMAGEDAYPVDVAPHILTAWNMRLLRGDLPQSEIAKRLGMTYQAYQRLENPTKGNPTIKTLEKVARAFGKRLTVSMA